MVQRNERELGPLAAPTILAVDDDAAYLRCLEELLTGEGYRVLAASTGERALEIARGKSPDLILLDLYLTGGIDGFAVCRELKSDPLTNSIPVVCVTGMRDDRTRLSSLSSGANEFLAKPVDPAELLLRLRNTLRLRQAEDLHVRNEVLMIHQASLEAKNRELQAALGELQVADLALRESQALALESNAVLSAVLEHTSMLAAYLDTRFNFIWVNHAYAKASERHPFSFAGKNHFDLFPDRENQEIFQRVVDTGRPFFTFETSFDHPRQPGRGTTWWDWSLIPVLDQEQKVSGLVYTLFDVTERHNAEAQRQLLQERLLRVEQAEIVGKVAAGVAHEVRNPLHAIMSLTEALCLKAGGREGYDPFVRHIRAQVTRLADLMRELLDFGKPLDRERVSPVTAGELCREAEEHWRSHPAAAEHALCLECREPDDGAVVLADPAKLVQALLNLLENGADHSPDGAPLRLHASTGEEGSLVLEVVDAGAGIPETTRGRVFEPFFTTRRKGTGLGLCIVQRIAADLGGRIELKPNDPGPGTCARLTIPVSRGAAP